MDYMGLPIVLPLLIYTKLRFRISRLQFWGGKSYIFPRMRYGFPFSPHYNRIARYEHSQTRLSLSVLSNRRTETDPRSNVRLRALYLQLGAAPVDRHLPANVERPVLQA